MALREKTLPKNSLNILFVLRAPIGGLFRHVLDLAQELEKRGHKTGMVIDGSHEYIVSDEWQKSMRECFILGIHKLPMSRTLGLSDFFNPFKLNKIAKSLNIDVIHGHGAKGGFFARLARPKNSTALYTAHGGVLHYNKNSLAGKIFRKIEKLLMRRTDAMVFESVYAKREYLKQVGTPKFPTPVIHNGLLEKEFLPIKKTKDLFDFIFIGELRDIKGIKYLLEAIVDISLPDGTPATLAIAGAGPLKEKIEKQIKDFKLEKRIKLLGVRPARSVFAMGKCLVIPSLKESFPYILLESVAAKMPTITTNVGGISEIFETTKSSLLEPANSKALKTAMQEFLKNEKTAKILAKTRFEYAKEKFLLEKMVTDIEELYYSTLEKK